jgi:hypothetical protein
MRASCSPRLLPAVGLAGAAFAVILVFAFVTARDLVTFDLWPADPPARPLPQLVLRDPAPAAAPGPRAAMPTPVVRPPAVAAPAGSVPAGPSPATAPARPEMARAVTDPTAGVAQPPRAAPPAPPSPPSPPLVQRSSSPLRPVGDLLSATTTSVAGALRETTGALGGRTEALSPALATTVAALGVLLAATVQGTGEVLGGLLGSPASSAPGFAPPPG